LRSDFQSGAGYYADYALSISIWLFYVDLLGKDAWGEVILDSRRSKFKIVFSLVLKRIYIKNNGKM
jgi:hypothetical protein